MSCLRSSFTKSSEGGKNFGGDLCPDERLGGPIGNLQIVLDSGLQHPYAPERPAANPLIREGDEPALHHVDPGGAGRREMNVEAGSLCQPVAD